MIIVPGSSNLVLAQEIADILTAELAQVDISKFPNGEQRIWVKTSLKDKVAVIVQSFSTPVDEHIVQLTLLADACKHLGAEAIIAVVPWLGYSPQDKSFREGEPISVHVVARMIEAIGVNALIAADIHSPAVLDMFSIPTIEVSAIGAFVDYFKNQDLRDHIIVSIDKGARSRSDDFAAALGLPKCQFDKKRDRHTGEVSFELVSGEVAGKTAISFDDFISTGSTQIGACNQLKALGANAYMACVTHAVFAGSNTTIKLLDSEIDQILTTNTYPIPNARHFNKLEVISLAETLAGQIEALATQLTPSESSE